MVQDLDIIENWHVAQKAEYKYLGPLKGGLDRSKISDTGLNIADEMNRDGGHSYLRRSCRDFVKKLYAAIKAS